MARRAAPAECNFSLCKLGADFIRFSLKLQNVLKPWDDVFFFLFFCCFYILNGFLDIRGELSCVHSQLGNSVHFFLINSKGSQIASKLK